MNIKITSVLIAVCCLFITKIHAQEESTETATTSRLAYQEGDVSLNMGVSFGLIGYGWGYSGWSSSFTVPLSANVDFGLSEYFSAGGYVGYMGRSYSGTYYGGDEFKYKFRSYSFGVHGAFHASSFLNNEFDFSIDESKVDYYAKLVLGYEVYSWNYEVEGDKDFYDEFDTDSGRMIFGPVLGVRYMFKPNLGGYIEGGRGTFGWLTLGVSLKL